eukprot:NODE_11573_length_1277_cov_6.591304.p1 GENE.NODE_11573_length_1277_cov_6.591304~~NODE_11573_length_1277_cov_6.591304.p1  ORF type:complete len:364 (+),score=105.34 NODE_11573_length_1277_cov_6.591304:48-1139(+)
MPLSAFFLERESPTCCSEGRSYLRALRTYKDRPVEGLRPLFGGESYARRGMCIPALLLQMLRQHSCAAPWKKWGFPERILSVLDPWLTHAMLQLDRADAVITIPMHVAYLQHCKYLFILFFLIFPLAMKTSGGLWQNIVSPFLLFCFLYGAEHLSDMFENPMGDDLTDLNVLEMIHDFEVRACEVFVVTTNDWWRMRGIYAQALQDNLLLKGEEPFKGTEDDDAFRKLCVGWGLHTHFAWMTMPPNVTQYVVKLGSGQKLSAKECGRLEDFALAGEEGSASNKDFTPFAKRASRRQQFLFSMDDYLHFESVTSFICLKANESELKLVLAEYTAMIANGEDTIEALAGVLEHWRPQACGNHHRL